MGFLKYLIGIFIIFMIILGSYPATLSHNIRTMFPIQKQDRLSNISTFAVYYGSELNVSDIEFLNEFNLVILQPDAFSGNNLSLIHSIKIAYIDLGEYDGAFPNFLNNSTVSTIEIGYDYNWSQPIVNVSSPIWINYIREEINYSIALGFNGFLFDDLDVVQEYPQEFNGFIKIIKIISEEYPNEIIIVNRGFELLPYIHYFINGVLYEDFGTYYNFINSSYGYYSFLNYSQIKNLTNRIELIKTYGLFVLGLGYSPHPYSIGDPFTNFVKILGNELNVPTFVSNVNLTYLGNYLPNKTIKILEN